MSDSRNRFQDKVAFITGANDRGIGGAIAEALGERRARRCICSRSKNPVACCESFRDTIAIIALVLRRCDAGRR